MRPRFERSSRRIELAGQPSESIDNPRRNYRSRTFASCWWLVLGRIWTLAGRIRFVNRFIYLPVTGEDLLLILGLKSVYGFSDPEMAMHAGPPNLDKDRRPDAGPRAGNIFHFFFP